MLANLRNVAEDDLLWTPTGGDRTIRQMIEHVGGCKYMYENHAFGDGGPTWNDPLVVSPASLDGAIEWLRDAHRRFRGSISELDDGDLSSPRRTHWGELMETRWIISQLMEHDLYHAGEINHIRELRQSNDRWR